MSQKHLESSRSSIESCTLQLLSWRPFNRSKTLDSFEQPQKPYGSTSTPKRPCFSDRSTSFSIEAMSRLSLAEEDNGGKTSASNYNSRGSFRLVARKRRRRNSRSVSGRSSDRICCSIGGHGTCSDFPFVVGTDSSGELFGEANWASDVSEARNSRRERRDSGGEKEASGFGFAVGIDPMGNESGYGSEPGYRGDAEFGYGDEFDDEEEDVKPLFWGAKGKGDSVTVETCPHYLAFSAEEIPKGDTRFKCSPPIRDAANREKLWEAMMEGDIDMLSSDHSPTEPELKLMSDGNFLKAWGGISSLQFVLPVTWSYGKKYGVTLEQVASWWSDKPSKLAGLHSKGAIAVGKHADIVVWEPEVEFDLDENHPIHFKHPSISAYLGRRLSGKVVSTFVRGNLVFGEGKHASDACGSLLLAS